MTWVGLEETGGRHVPVPKELVEEAEKWAKKEIEGDDEEEEDRMEE